MPCEMCGKEVPRLRKVQIGGSTLEVCNECARFGTEERKEAPQSDPVVPGNTAMPPPRRYETTPAQKRDALSRGEMELVDEYPERIKAGRRRKGLTQEDLARRLNEKKSVISRLETGEMRPSDRMVRKLEKELDIKLREPLEYQVEATTKDRRRRASGGVTLGDLIRMEK